MDIIRATEILKGLSEGVDPFTGEVLSDDCICNHAEVVRAFYCILNELDKLSKKTQKPRHENAGKPWSEEDDDTLAKMYDSGCSKKEIQDHFKRSEGAIAARLVYIGRIDSRDTYRYGK